MIMSCVLFGKVLTVCSCREVRRRLMRFLAEGGAGGDMRNQASANPVERMCG